MPSMRNMGPSDLCAKRENSLEEAEWAETLSSLLPGYVFAYTYEGEERGARYVGIEHVIHVLKYQDGTETLIGQDLEFADWLWRIGGKVGVMKALETGDRVEIIDGVFQTLHGTIIRMNRRRRKKCVSIEMQGNPIKSGFPMNWSKRRIETGRSNLTASLVGVKCVDQDGRWRG